VQLVIEVEESAAERMLEGSPTGSSTRARILQLLGEAMVEYETDVFATRGHGTWAPLDPATIAAKGSSRILVDTGGLLAASPAAPRSTGSPSRSTGTEYAGYLKYGARGMPRRDPAPEPDHSDVERWADEVLGFLSTGAPCDRDRRHRRRRRVRRRSRPHSASTCPPLIEALQVEDRYGGKIVQEWQQLPTREALVSANFPASRSPPPG
jgi:hypothetical protein